MNNRKMKKLAMKKAQILTTNKYTPQWCKALKTSLSRLYNINAIIEYDTIYGYVVSIFNSYCEKLTFTSEASFSHEAVCDFM